VPRSYELGRRRGAVEGTRRAILAAARDLVGSGDAAFSTDAIARRAGVSRITVYNHFGSKAGLLLELAAGAHHAHEQAGQEPADPRDQLRKRITASCALWASNPGLFRHLPRVGGVEFERQAADRALAERLAAGDQLRPGCSLKEAQDVIGAVSSFEVFDRLHQDGRRPQTAVVEILMRLASTLLSSKSAQDDRL
jgi:AcrR family transcriptional regulator